MRRPSGRRRPPTQNLIFVSDASRHDLPQGIFRATGLSPYGLDTSTKRIETMRRPSGRRRPPTQNLIFVSDASRHDLPQGIFRATGLSPYGLDTSAKRIETMRRPLAEDAPQRETHFFFRKLPIDFSRLLLRCFLAARHLHRQAPSPEKEVYYSRY